MLTASLATLRAQWPLVRGDARFEEAYREGVRRFREYYGERLFNEARARMRSGAWLQGARDTLLVLRHSPRVLARRAGAKLSRGGPRA